MANEVPEPVAPAVTVVAPGGPPTSDDKTVGMLCHLGGIFWLLPPLIIWLIKKDQSKFVDDQGKESLNFQITMAIAHAICLVLTFVVIGAFLWPVIWLVNLIFCIMGGMAANKGEKYRYPFAIRLIK